MDRALTEQGLRVVVSDTALPGRVEWAPDSAALTFYPSTPVPAASSGSVLLSLAPWSRAGVETLVFSSGSAAPAGSTVRWNLTNSLPSDGVLEVAFDRDLPADFVRTATARSISAFDGEPDNKQVIALQVSRRTARIFRLTAKQPFDLKNYSVELSSSDGGTQKAGFSNAGYVTPTSRRVDAGPTDEMGDVPLNGLIWLEAHTLLNPFTVNPRVSVGGETFRFVPETADSGMLVLLHPVGLLRGNCVYTVEFQGLDDMADRPLPARTWTFHTGTGADFTATTLKSWSPKGTATTTATPQVTSTKPVFYTRSALSWDSAVPYDFAWSLPGVRVQGSIQASSDGRTLSYVPSRPWPVDTTIALLPDRFRYHDWTGAEISEAGASGGSSAIAAAFFTGSACGTPAAVAVRNPQPDAADVPRNVRIQARFENGVLESSLAGVTLTTDGTAVPVLTALAGDGRTVTIAPARILDANRLYTATLAGVLSTDGTPRDGAEQWSFTTSSVAIGTPARPVVVPSWSDPFSFRVLFTRPLNPVSLDPGDVHVVLNQRQMAVDIGVEEDGRALRRTPSVPPSTGGVWHVSATGLADSAGLSFPDADLTIPAADPGDNQPPRVQSLLPAPDAIVAWNASAIVAFDRSISLRQGPAGVRLSANGTHVASTVQFPSSDSLSISPLLNWRPGATYRVDVSGVLDANGNEAAALSWRFTIASDGLAEASALRLVSVSPAWDAVGVATDSPLVLEFSRLVFVTGGYHPFPLASRPAPPAGLRVLSDQNRVRVELVPAWRPGMQTSVEVAVRDIYGWTANAQARFSTAASDDKDPPRIESITPAPGSSLPAGVNEFRVLLSEPVVAGGSSVRFSANGVATSQGQLTVPAQGDGRTLVVTLTVPASTSGTLDFSADLTDLSGNALQAVSFEYTVDSSAGEGWAQVTRIQPADGSADVPLDAAITLQFNVPMNDTSVRNAIRVSDDGYRVPVTLTPDAAGCVWTMVPSAPWQPGTVVVVGVDSTAFSLSGLRMPASYRAQFQTLAARPTASSNASPAALRASRRSVDIRFAAPSSTPPEEPFGLRQGQLRIPVVIDRMGPAWYRLRPGTALEAGEQYTLMAGPGVEIPLRIAAEESADSSGDPLVTRDKSGRLMMRLEEPIHAFGVDSTTLVLLDRNGNEVPHEARLAADGRSVVIEPFGALPVEALRWRERRVAIH